MAHELDLIGGFSNGLAIEREVRGRPYLDWQLRGVGGRLRQIYLGPADPRARELRDALAAYKARREGIVEDYMDYLVRDDVHRGLFLGPYAILVNVPDAGRYPRESCRRRPEAPALMRDGAWGIRALAVLCVLVGCAGPEHHLDARNPGDPCFDTCPEGTSCTGVTYEHHKPRPGRCELLSGRCATDADCRRSARCVRTGEALGLCAEAPQI